MGCLYSIKFPNNKMYIGYTMKNASIRLNKHIEGAKFGGMMVAVKKGIITQKQRKDKLYEPC